MVHSFVLEYTIKPGYSIYLNYVIRYGHLSILKTIIKYIPNITIIHKRERFIPAAHPKLQRGHTQGANCENTACLSKIPGHILELQTCFETRFKESGPPAPGITNGGGHVTA